MTCREVFADIYHRKVWGDDSGGGSSPEAAAPFVELANRLIAERKPLTVLDIGCGYGSVASRLELRGAHYMGIDCVDSVIRKATASYTWASFCCLDALRDPLPMADLVLVKEITQHLSDTHVRLLLARLRRYPAILHCSAIIAGEETGVTFDGGCRSVRLNSYGVDVTEVTMSHGWVYGGSEYLAELWEPRA